MPDPARSDQKTNHRLHKQDVNPLHIAADILARLVDRPLSSVWHPIINEWAQQRVIHHAAPRS